MATADQLMTLLVNFHGKNTILQNFGANFLQNTNYNLQLSVSKNIYWDKNVPVLLRYTGK